MYTNDEKYLKLIKDAMRTMEEMEQLPHDHYSSLSSLGNIQDPHSFILGVRFCRGVLVQELKELDSKLKFALNYKKEPKL
jgi:hypothetical protein